MSEAIEYLFPFTKFKFLNTFYHFISFNKKAKKKNLLEYILIIDSSIPVSLRNKIQGFLMQTLTFHFKRGDWNLMLKPCFYFQCYCQSFNNSLDLSLQSVSVEEVITFFYSYYHKRTINFYNDSLHLLKKCPEKIYYHYYIIFSYKAVWSWDLTFIFACFEDCWMALNMFLRFFICQKMMKSINI